MLEKFLKKNKKIYENKKIEVEDIKTMEQYGDFKSIEEKCIFLKDTFHLTVVGHNDELDEVTYQFLLATVVNLKWH